MFETCETLTPIVQRNSIDEGYLDLRPCGFSTVSEVEAAVRQVQQTVWDRLQITVSFGIASNKLVAQIASKLRKPGGFVVVPCGDEESFLAPLAAGKLPGIGPKTESALVEQHGIRLIRDITTRTEDELHAIFGTGWREMLATARGIDCRPVETGHDAAKSYSQQETFGRDIRDFAAIEQIAKRMIDELMPAIRADGKRVRTMTVKIRYPDFAQESRARSLEAASDLEAPFYPLVEPLLRAAWRKPRPLRLVSIRFSGVDDGAAQLEIFGQADERRRRLAGVLDRLNDGKGNAVVRHGHQLRGRNSGQAAEGS
jgi:DNA polymerase-4